MFPPYRLSGKEGILAFIKRVGCIQFDPLNIVGRNPDLVLQARVLNYKGEMLHDLLYQDRRLLDGPDKEMSIYRTEDWPYFARKRREAINYLKNSLRGKPAVAAMAGVRKEIKKLGPVCSADLALDQIVDWSWSPTKLSRAVLEAMYHCGELIIHHRAGTRKVYDFAGKHLPPEIFSAREPNRGLDEYRAWYLLRRIGSIGLLWNKSGEAWLGVFKSRERKSAIEKLLRSGLLKIVCVGGIAEPFYLRTSDLELLERSLECRETRREAAIIAPLDNFLWDRKLVYELFDFSYRWEVYKPAREREYGYYVLPILYGDRLVARFEPGRDKKNGTLLVKNFWWEKGAEQSSEQKQAIRECLRRFLAYLDCQRLVVNGNKAGNLSWLAQC